MSLVQTPERAASEPNKKGQAEKSRAQSPVRAASESEIKGTRREITFPR